MTEALSDDDDTKVLTTTTEASAEEAYKTTHLSERLRQKMRRFFYGIRVLMTKTTSLAE